VLCILGRPALFDEFDPDRSIMHARYEHARYELSEEVNVTGNRYVLAAVAGVSQSREGH
jgi:hypothetical protein